MVANLTKDSFVSLRPQDMHGVEQCKYDPCINDIYDDVTADGIGRQFKVGPWV